MSGVHNFPFQWGKDTIIQTLHIMALNMSLKGGMSNYFNYPIYTQKQNIHILVILWLYPLKGATTLAYHGKMTI